MGIRYEDKCTTFCDNAQCVKYSNNNGQCDNSGVCACSENYFPSFNCTVFCNVSECAQSMGNRSHCSGNYWKFVMFIGVENGCVCNQHYFGESCDMYCVNGVYRSGKCECLKNYYGDSCDVYCESSETCNSKGVCGDDGLCICDDGYEVTQCIMNKLIGRETIVKVKSTNLCFGSLRQLLVELVC
jgi:hypothetical protein